MFHFSSSFRRFSLGRKDPAGRASLKRAWLQAPDEGIESPSDRVPLGYLLAQALLLAAHALQERGALDRAERLLNNARRLIGRLRLPANVSRAVAVERQEFLRSLGAQRLEIQARIQECRGDRKGALRSLEQSLVLSEGFGTSAYLLAKFLIEDSHQAPHSFLLKAERAIESDVGRTLGSCTETD